MQIDTQFCNEVIQEYSKRFSKDEIENGFKGMDIHTASIAMEIFKIAFEKLESEKHSR